MPNSTSLHPGARMLVAATTVAAALLALPAGHAEASVATPAATSPTATTSGTTATRTTTTSTTMTRAERRAHRRMVRRQKTRHAFRIGLRQIGDPYVYGATGPGSFDCSGLTSYSYHRAGFRLPRTSSAQSGAVRHIPRSRLRLGDLVFFTSGGHVYHVGMYAGHRNGGYYVLHAPYPGKHVEVERIWTGSWFGGTLR